QAGLANQVGLSRPDRRDVQLVAADDGDADPDRAVVAGAVEAEPLPLMAEPLVGRRDRLLDADADAGRLVVVIHAADRLGRALGRLLGPRRGDRRCDDQVQMALRPRDRADRRLDDDDGVRRVGGAVGLGDDAELHLETDGQVRVSRGLWGAGSRRAARNAEAEPEWFGTDAPRLAGRSGQYTRRGFRPGVCP